MARFEYETKLACHHEALFDFLLRPQNVARVSDPNTGLRMVSAPEVVQPGSRIEFVIMGYGKQQTGVHEIVEVVRPERIVEVQIAGPLKSWRHEHLFEPSDSGVRMWDVIDFEPPGGLLGFIATEGRISSSLEEAFFNRERELERLVASGELYAP